jgi:hypothetical protein
MGIGSPLERAKREGGGGPFIKKQTELPPPLSAPSLANLHLAGDRLQFRSFVVFSGGISETDQNPRAS